MEFEDEIGIGFVGRNGDAAIAVTVDSLVVEGLALGVVIVRTTVVSLRLLVELELELGVVVKLGVKLKLELESLVVAAKPA